VAKVPIAIVNAERDTFARLLDLIARIDPAQRNCYVIESRSADSRSAAISSSSRATAFQSRRRSRFSSDSAFSSSTVVAERRNAVTSIIFSQ